MLRVAAIGEYICDNWRGKIDKKSVVSALLLHDTGNLLKFDLTKGVELFDESERNIEYWLEVKKSMQQKFGTNEHMVTKNIAFELNVGDRVIQLIENMGSSNLVNTVALSDYELKVVTYSDLRVGPFGCLTVKERFADIINRYKDRGHELSNMERTMERMDKCLVLETQLKEQVTMDLQLITTEMMDELAEKLRSREV
jgi:hypothetical protein